MAWAGASGWPHPPHCGPRPHQSRAHLPGPASLGRVPQTRDPRGQHKRLHAGAEDGGQGVRGGGHIARNLLRAQDDHGGISGHHRAHDAGRAKGPRLPRLLSRLGDAVLLPHCRLPQAGTNPTRAQVLLPTRCPRSFLGRCCAVYVVCVALVSTSRRSTLPLLSQRSVSEHRWTS